MILATVAVNQFEWASVRAARQQVFDNKYTHSTPLGSTASTSSFAATKSELIAMFDVVQSIRYRSAELTRLLVTGTQRCVRGMRSV